MNLKQLFCKHIFEKTGTLREDGIWRNGEATGGTFSYRLECTKCDKILMVRVTEEVGK